MKYEYVSGLYMRLSKDDYKDSESDSISTQRKLLKNYCKENKISVYKEYIDDGFSGTNFDRPAFKEMLHDIELKKINTVIVKDLSRLGREYIQSGHYQEVYFPSKGIRFVAINDRYDSIKTENFELAPFKNLVNEFYARDTSKKIRSSFYALMKDGEFVGNFAPYGYMKSLDDRHKLVPDPNTCETVKLIFSLACKNLTPKNIADFLTENNYPTPLEYRSKNITGRKWSFSTVSKIISNEVYIGNMIQGKTTKLSFKTNTVKYNTKEECIIVKNTHEPIVSKSSFYKANKLKKQRICR